MPERPTNDRIFGNFLNFAVFLDYRKCSQTSFGVGNHFSKKKSENIFEKKSDNTFVSEEKIIVYLTDIFKYLGFDSS